MSLTPWKVLESKHVQPSLRIDKCELPNGTFLDAHVLEFRSWANIIALTKDHEVVLIQQYRHGVKEVMWEIPGGVVDDAEDPLEGVKRELLEETGYIASEIIHTGTLYPNPAIQTNSMYCYLALGAEKVSEQDLDDGEEIEVHLMPFSELIEMTKRGGFPHALQVAALFLAASHLKRIS